MFETIRVRNGWLVNCGKFRFHCLAMVEEAGLFRIVLLMRSEPFGESASVDVFEIALLFFSIGLVWFEKVYEYDETD